MITTDDDKVIFSIGEKGTGIMKKGYKAFIINDKDEEINLMDEGE